MKQILLFISAILISAPSYSQLQQWTTVSSNVTTEQETSNSTEGNSSLKVTWRSKSNQDIESESFQVTAETPFSYTLDVLDNDAAGRVRLVIIFDNNNSYSSIYSEDNASWSNIEYTGNVPTGATTAKIRLRFYDISSNWDGDATVYVDNAIYTDNGGLTNLIPDGGFENWPATNTVETPEFSPAEGVYYTAQQIALSSKTSSATIYYTTNGSAPTNLSTQYTAPFEISSTTEVKAIAYKDGLPESVIATSTYSFPIEVATIAELRSQSEGNICKLTGEAILSFQQDYRKQKYLQDETGGIAIDDNQGIITSTYNVGDGITGITGTLGNYGQVLQIIPLVNPGTATSTGNTIEPSELTISQLEANWSNFESKLIKINNVNFGASAGASFSYSSKNLDVTDGNNDNIVLRLNFQTDFDGETIPTTAIVTGIAIQYNGTFQIAPRYMSDVAIPTKTEFNSTSQRSIFPNPFKDVLKIQGENMAEVELINTLGMVVEQINNINQNEYTITTNSLANGIYLVKITDTNGNVKTEKVIKK